jgi:hypothetical protein
MYCAVLLHIAAVLQDDTAPVASQGCSRAYITVPAYYDFSCYDSLRMNKGGGMNDRNESLKGIKHGDNVLTR